MIVITVHGIFMANFHSIQRSPDCDKYNLELLGLNEIQVGQADCDGVENCDQFMIDLETLEIFYWQN